MPPEPGVFIQSEEGQALGFIDRILLFVYSLAVGVLSLLIVTHIFGVDWFGRFLSDFPYQMQIAAVILFLVSLRFLLYRTGSSSEPQVITHKTEHGEVRISIQTLESLAERATRLIRGVSDLKTKVRPSDVGIHIAVRISVDPDLDIPQITSSVQEKVKDYVESTAGVTVRDVVVYVSDISKANSGKVPARPRVE